MFSLQQNWRTRGQTRFCLEVGNVNKIKLKKKKKENDRSVKWRLLRG
jgi:hypothetical protein